MWVVWEEKDGRYHGRRIVGWVMRGNNLVLFLPDNQTVAMSIAGLAWLAVYGDVEEAARELMSQLLRRSRKLDIEAVVEVEAEAEGGEATDGDDSRDTAATTDTRDWGVRGRKKAAAVEEGAGR